MADGDDYIDKVADYMIHWCRMEKGLKMEIFADLSAKTMQQPETQKRRRRSKTHPPLLQVNCQGMSA
jgi:hypothetical protein